MGARSSRKESARAQDGRLLLYSDHETRSYQKDGLWGVQKVQVASRTCASTLLIDRAFNVC